MTRRRKATPWGTIPVFTLLLVAVALGAGCSSPTSTTPQTSPGASKASPPSSAQSASELSTTAPTDLATAKRLLGEKRVLFDTSQMVGLSPGSPPGSPGTMAALTKALDVPLRVPDPALVGTPTSIWTWNVKSGAYHASAVYPGDLRWQAMQARNKVYGFPGRVQRSPVATDSLVPYASGGSKGYMTLVSIRGNVGAAQTRYSVGDPKNRFTASPSRLEWVEDGVYYELTSFQLDPDQLLAIAGTTVVVNP
jgi:hypothetical protein